MKILKSFDAEDLEFFLIITFGIGCLLVIAFWIQSCNQTERLAIKAGVYQPHQPLWWDNRPKKEDDSP